MSIDNIAARSFAARIEREVIDKVGKDNTGISKEAIAQVLNDGQITNEEFNQLSEASGNAEAFKEVLTGHLGQEAVSRLQSADAEPVEIAFFDGDNAIAIPETAQNNQTNEAGWLRHVVEDDSADQGRNIEVTTSMITVDVDGNKATLNFDNFTPSDDQINAKINELNSQIDRANAAIQRHNQQNPNNQLELKPHLDANNAADRQSAVNALAQDEAKRIAGEAGLRVDSGILKTETAQEQGANTSGNSFSGTITIRQTGADQ